MNLFKLKHLPHCPDVVFGVSPVTSGVKVAELEGLNLTEVNLCDGPRVKNG